MKSLAVLSTVLVLFCAQIALAKRGAPKDVTPVKLHGVEYRAPHQHMGFVEAFDDKGELLWRRQIYVVRFTPGLERDVQDVFITAMESKGNTLIVKNERGSEYQLDLDGLEVKVLKGAAVESRK